MAEPIVRFLSDIVRETKEATAIKMYMAAAEKIKYDADWHTASQDLKNAYLEAASYSYAEAVEGVEKDV